MHRPTQKYSPEKAKQVQSWLNGSGSAAGDASRNSLVGLEEPQSEQRKCRNESEESERSIDVEEAKIMHVNETRLAPFSSGLAGCNRRVYQF